MYYCVYVVHVCSCLHGLMGALVALHCHVVLVCSGRTSCAFVAMSVVARRGTCPILGAFDRRVFLLSLWQLVSGAVCLPALLCSMGGLASSPSFVSPVRLVQLWCPFLSWHAATDTRFLAGFIEETSSSDGMHLVHVCSGLLRLLCKLGPPSPPQYTCFVRRRNLRFGGLVIEGMIRRRAGL